MLFPNQLFKIHQNTDRVSCCLTLVGVYEWYLGWYHNCGSNDFSQPPNIAIAPNDGRLKITQVTDKGLLQPCIEKILKKRTILDILEYLTHPLHMSVTAFSWRSRKRTSVDIFLKRLRCLWGMSAFAGNLMQVRRNLDRQLGAQLQCYVYNKKQCTMFTM